VRSKFSLACLIVVLAAPAALAQHITGDVIGVHDLSNGSHSPITGARPGSCSYCHVPHSGIGGNAPLWNQTLSKQVYSTYSSSTYHQKGNPQPSLGGDSSLCLSCHDGTVAPGQTVLYGKVSMAGEMRNADILGTNLQGSHPFSLVLPIKDSADLVASLAAQGKTADPTEKVRLIKGNVECTSCHNPHVQALDKISENFLVRDSSSAQLCLACHDPKRTMAKERNPLAGWSTGVHALATNKTTPLSNVGSYGTVGQNACISCHIPHNAPGPVRLLRAPNEQDCISCHGAGSAISPAALNVFAEFAKVGHPFPSGIKTHDVSENVMLNNNRHATCADCHNAHASSKVVAFTPPPAIRPSQLGVAGVNASDGQTALTPAVNQYENCLRCHGASAGKTENVAFGYSPARAASAGDPLNIIPQFNVTASSSHPVTHDRSSGLPQPSLLTNMLNLDGATQGRLVGRRIFCTDCHNSDDNREFGGTGPNGPHGSRFTHILERRYEFNQAIVPGQMITNLFPNPDLSVNGPYALCGKCHNLRQVVSNTSFKQHALHINAGFSCSSCHTAHGVGNMSSAGAGERLVNFDANVVGAGSTGTISYNRAANTCTLTCHGAAHSPTGKVSINQPGKIGTKK
jgi:predicted CXXCH cytochrome family protein